MNLYFSLLQQAPARQNTSRLNLRDVFHSMFVGCKWPVEAEQQVLAKLEISRAAVYMQKLAAFLVRQGSRKALSG